MKKKHRFSVSLYALTVTSIVLATLAAVSVCITIFVTVYSRALMRDAKLSAEQAVRQTELAVNANLDTMKEDLSSVLRLVKESAGNGDQKEGFSAHRLPGPIPPPGSPPIPPPMPPPAPLEVATEVRVTEAVWLPAVRV